MRLRALDVFLVTWSIGSALAIAYLWWTRAGAPAAASPSTAIVDRLRVRTLEAERVDVVTKDGALRLVLANEERLPPPTMDGKPLGPARGTPGVIFFCSSGDECGGLIYDASGAHAGGSLTFDQLRQDQTVALQYIEDDGVRTAGLAIYDRPRGPLSDTARELERIDHLPAGAAKDAAQAAIGARLDAENVSRLFVGKNRKAESVLELKDAKGRPRLRLSVAPDGATGIEVLDEQGAVTRRL